MSAATASQWLAVAGRGDRNADSLAARVMLNEASRPWDENFARVIEANSPSVACDAQHCVSLTIARTPPA